VLADRLTHSGKKTVLLLEPGPSPRGSLKVAVPVALTKLFFSDWDWQWKAPPTARVPREIHLARGRALGGSSATNALLYHRGAAADFDDWGVGWGSAEMLPAFLAAERQTRRSLRGSRFHSSAGSVGVEDTRYTNALSALFLQASQQAGFPMNPDFNNWDTPQLGVGRFQQQTLRGRRCHAASAYLRRATGRPNLHVQTDARATMVALDGDRATAVEYLDSSGERRCVPVAAKGGEVILCAGAVNTPQLLMLSGIGPLTELAAHGIPAHVELPGVGCNLADHPAVTAGYTVHKRVSITDQMMLPGTGVLNPVRLAQWLALGRGPLASTGCDHGGFFATAAAAENGLADLQVRFVAGLGTQPDGVASYRDIGRGGQPRSGMTLQAIAIRPRSRGRVRLASADPEAPPLVQPSFLSASSDRQTLREGIRICRKIAAQAAFDGMRGVETWPGAAAVSDADLDEYVSKVVHSANGLSGSCRMGRDDDEMAVVDESLRVRGVRGLRVVDASVMPSMPGGQLGATTFALAERASSIILAGEA